MDVFKSNSYPGNFINDCFKVFLDNKEKVITVTKKLLFLVLSYLGPLSLETRIKLRKYLKGTLNCNWTRTQKHLVHKWTLNHLAKLAKWLSCVVSTYLYGAFDCMFLFTYAFQSESTLYSCQNIKEFLTQSRHKIWSLSDCNWTQTRNHLVHKWTLNHLVKLTKWLSCVVST